MNGLATVPAHMTLDVFYEEASCTSAPLHALPQPVSKGSAPAGCTGAQLNQVRDHSYTQTIKLSGLQVANVQRPWGSLPTDILTQIFDHLAPLLSRDLRALRQVCKQWRAAGAPCLHHFIGFSLARLHTNTFRKSESPLHR